MLDIYCTYHGWISSFFPTIPSGATKTQRQQNKTKQKHSSTPHLQQDLPVPAVLYAVSRYPPGRPKVCPPRTRKLAARVPLAPLFPRAPLAAAAPTSGSRPRSPVVSHRTAHTNATTTSNTATTAPATTAVAISAAAPLGSTRSAAVCEERHPFRRAPRTRCTTIDRPAPRRGCLVPSLNGTPS